MKDVEKMEDPEKDIHGKSRKEISLIIHPDKTYIDPKTGEEKPTPEGLKQTGREMSEINRSRKGGVHLYSTIDNKKGWILFFNKQKLQDFRENEESMNKVIKGILDNRDYVLDDLKQPKPKRKKVTQNFANYFMNKMLEKQRKKLERERNKALKKQKEAEVYVQ